MRAPAVLVLPVLLAALAGLAGLWPLAWTSPEPIPPRAPSPVPVVVPYETPKAIADLTSAVRRLAIPDRGPLAPTAIVIHSTSGYSLAQALFEMEKRGMGVHILIDVDGTAYRLVDLDRQVRAARGIDDVALHVSVVGRHGDELAAQEKSLEAAAKIVAALADHHAIPRTNHDVISRRGIFSHMQVKYRFGGLKLGEAKDGMEPGEPIMKALLEKIGGEFHEELKWKDRRKDGWMLVMEGGSTSKITRGRDLTPMPPPALKSVEMVDARRQRYVDRGPIVVTGVVLHFTFTDTFDEAIQSWETRLIGPHILVDADGTAYQLMDSLDEKAAAAGGTNEACVQIEIVGKGERVLLANDVQMKKVVGIVNELSAKYSIPKSNKELDSLRGIFSHTQAKKRWGRSSWLWGRDFDPGENYMKKVIEAAGGAYAEEKDWAGRTSGDWCTHFDDWLP